MTIKIEPVSESLFCDIKIDGDGVAYTCGKGRDGSHGQRVSKTMRAVSILNLADTKAVYATGEDLQVKFKKGVSCTRADAGGFFTLDCV